jgi:sugar phosphate isomerase/epimerase
MLSRRKFSKMALAGIPLSATFTQLVFAQKKINSTIAGVPIGSQSYSFRNMTLDECLKSMALLGLGVCELYAPHVEPKDPATGRALSRTALRDWRLSTSMDVFKAARKKFDAVGIELSAYNYSFKDDFTDPEIDRGFEMAKALGVGIITASSTLTSAKRVVPFAEKHNMTVAYHGHDDVADSNQFAKPEAFAAAMAMSKHFQVNLDIGHFVAAGYDPVKYISENHDHILVLHIKDRKKNRGANLPWGQGDTPIKEVLQLLRDKKYRIPALIEYEYQGTDAATEVKKCFDYAKAALL